ncbi:Poly(A) polymerase I [BD1-7 clade bacterium]|uniref:Poly(A) polymerase I n=1 Tax=BD1-7 clade bacterium TaxID=2029982 RepID=A0A5S9MZ28_9GAMM|nr:Poly(A) polymerase I [BD1-7 clade bacterium]
MSNHKKQQVLPASSLAKNEHGVSERLISPNALKVIQRLNTANYQAYLVGGAVRDMMLGKQPKDFDVATNATPEQVRKLFKNARIIGRRFQIVHVRYGREIIEVTTFRGNHDNVTATSDNAIKKQSAKNDHGMLLRDNVFGTVEEDALRRDLTINAFYYSPETHQVHDFADGISDLEAGTIRLIGDPAVRYQEDPVRILRAIRFAAKLGFKLEAQTAQAIDDNAPLLSKIPSARLFDETGKLFGQGQAFATWHGLAEHGLLSYLFCNAELVTQDPIARALIDQALNNTDKRLATGKSVTPAFIFAVILWPSVAKLIQEYQHDQMPAMAALHAAANQLLSAQTQFTSIPKRFQVMVKEIWELQLRLPQRTGQRAYRLLEHPRFRAAYDFLLLREAAGDYPKEEELGQWWTDFQTQNSSEREDAVEEANTANHYRKRGKRSNQRNRRSPR